jgi:DNA repair protein RadC
VGLCGRPFDLELSDADADGGGNVRPPSAADQERCRSLLDALLRPAWPRDAAAWADALIAEFGSLPAALAAGSTERARTVGGEAARFLASIQTALLHCLRLPLAERPVISTSKQLLDYLQADMTNLINERFRVLFLTSQNELMADDLIWEGTVGEAPAYPREVVKRALEVGATGVILVHNHPSGNHQPSQGDVDATRRIAQAALIMGICVHDHIVISRAGWSSFRRLGLFEVLPSPRPD